MCVFSRGFPGPGIVRERGIIKVSEEFGRIMVRCRSVGIASYVISSGEMRRVALEPRLILQYHVEHATISTPCTSS